MEHSMTKQIPLTISSTHEQRRLQEWNSFGTPERSVEKKKKEEEEEEKTKQKKLRLHGGAGGCGV